MGVFLGVFYTAWYQAEKITTRDNYAILVAAIGTFMYISFSNKLDPQRGELTIDSITETLQPANIAPFMFMILIIVLGFLFLFLHCLKRFKNSFVGTTIPAIWGGIFQILTKMIVGLIVTSIIGKKNQFTMWETYLILALTIISFILQSHFLQNMFINYEFSMAIILYYTITCFVSVSSSQLIFSEWENTSFTQTILLFIGLFIQYIGIFILLSSHSNALSMYPVNEASIGGGPMIKVANVDLDEEEDISITHINNNEENDKFNVTNLSEKKIDIEI